MLKCRNTPFSLTKKIEVCLKKKKKKLFFFDGTNFVCHFSRMEQRDLARSKRKLHCNVCTSDEALHVVACCSNSKCCRFAGDEDLVAVIDPKHKRCVPEFEAKCPDCQVEGKVVVVCRMGCSAAFMNSFDGFEHYDEFTLDSCTCELIHSCKNDALSSSVLPELGSSRDTQTKCQTI